MNSDRRADLQRKLSMGAVPRPPAGLAERIKNDIPQYLQAGPERERFSRSVAFSMRVAASILLLITSVFVTLNLMEPDSKPASRSARVRLAPGGTHAPLRSQVKESAAAPAAVEEIRLDMTEPTPEQKVAPPPPPASPAPQLAEAREGRSRGNEADGDDQGSAAAVAPEPLSVTAEAPLLDEAPAPAFAAERQAMPSAAPAPAREERTERAAAGFLMKDAVAAGLDLERPRTLFGIAVDPGVFRRIKSTLENGEHPDGSSIDVEALVNYFAGVPAKPPRHGARLEVEASPAPVQAEGDHAVLRFTIDTAATETQAGATLPPAARDVRVEVSFNPLAVAAFRRAGESRPLAPEAVLLSNVSVTALYDLELRPHLKAAQRIATVSLHYTSLEDGRPRAVERVVYGRDLAGSWSHASRRHRLASLGAVWGQSLRRNSAPARDVARRAEELVTQNPKDPLARELASAANATGGGR